MDGAARQHQRKQSMSPIESVICYGVIGIVAILLVIYLLMFLIGSLQCAYLDFEAAWYRYRNGQPVDVGLLIYSFLHVCATLGLAAMYYYAYC